MTFPSKSATLAETVRFYLTWALVIVICVGAIAGLVYLYRRLG